MNKVNEKRLRNFRSLVKLSSKYENKSIKKVLAWYKEKVKNDKFKINKIPLNSLKSWRIKKNKITHLSGQFFEVIGIDIKKINNREVGKWDQPILSQKHGGVLSILVRKKANVIEFLLLARREPGDNSLKLCPSFSATKSNMNRAHGGKLTELYNEVMKNKKNIICDTYHYEEGARFFQKKNLNRLIWINKKDEIRINNKNFIWLNLSQIKKLNQYPGILNPFVKTILFMI